MTVNSDFKPKKIVMLTHDRNIDRRILQEAKSLISGGFEVTILALNPNENGDNTRSPFAYLQYVETKQLRSNVLMRLYQLYRYIKKKKSIF